MKKDDSDSRYWEDDFDRLKKRKNSTKKTSEYKRKEKYKKNYFRED